ncbi:MAG: ImmA/IrrE family metallo-endopeptidase [Planctomycetia bacterium]|nr:ImmA/IrrE family metallo-endopeptidase [Planctomycetia bacterium]
MFADLSTAEVHSALDGCCARLLDQAQIAEPPVDCFALAKGLGIVVGIDSRQSGRARCVRLSASSSQGQEAIFIRPDPRAERRHWAVAHEIGEHHAHEIFSRLGVDPSSAPPQTRERLADALAKRLLLPTAWFMQVGAECDWSLTDLKNSFATASFELLARRLLDRAAPAIVTIFDQGRTSFRADNFSGRRTTPTALELRVWTRCRRTASTQAESDRALRTRCWAVHEAEWKREILLTEPSELDLEQTAPEF